MKPSKECMKALTRSRQKYDRTVKLLEDHYGLPIKEIDDEYYVSRRRIPYGIDDCPLCELYYGTCNGCCIAEDTGLHSCVGTPYHEYEYILVMSTRVTKKLIKATKAERDYLADLEKRLRGER